MKKSISILGIILLGITLSCRSEEPDRSAQSLPKAAATKVYMKDGDSLPDSANGQTEPPRKDQLQWKP